MSKYKDVASKMRHKITLQSQVLTPDTIGGNTVSWSNLTTVWAKLDNLSGSLGRNFNSEKSFAGQLQDKTFYKITIRYVSGIDTKMRILFENKALNIKSVINVDEKNEFLEIFAEEGVAT
jgi:SPP1 family predicted phage head-tail adaptor